MKKIFIKNSKIKILLTFLISSVLFLNLSQAKIIHIPGDYYTIQGAINATEDGDEIIVSEGTYYGRIGLRGKNIVLRSTDPTNPDVVANTILDGMQEYDVIWFMGTENESCIVEGFTITNGKDAIYGGYPTHSCATIRYNTIIKNASPEDEYPDYAINSFDGIIEYNIISDNYGGAISDCNGVIQHNHISRNVRGGLIGCNGTIHNNVIVYNSFHQNAYTVIYKCNGTIISNIIGYNSHIALYLCSGLIQNNYIYVNETGISNCTGTIQNNTIFRNFGSGGIIKCTGLIENCIIWLNQGKQISESSVPSYCCIQDWDGSGVGNISDDPKFIINLKLGADSPCIDAGKFIEGLTTDFDGDRRGIRGVSEPRGDASYYDIGADEFYRATDVLNWSIWE